MNRRTRRFGGVVLLGAAAIALAGCGSDDGPVAAPAPSTPQEAPVVAGDDPAADVLKDAADEPQVPDVYIDLRTAFGGYDPMAAQLPADLQSQYAELKAEVDHVSALTGPDAVQGYADVKADIDSFERALQDLTGDDRDQAVIDAWDDVKSEFDQIDAGF